MAGVGIGKEHDPAPRPRCAPMQGMVFPYPPGGQLRRIQDDEISDLTPEPLKNLCAVDIRLIVDHNDLRPPLLRRQRTEDTLKIDLLIAGGDDDGDFSGPQIHPRAPSRRNRTTDKKVRLRRNLPTQDEILL